MKKAFLLLVAVVIVAIAVWILNQVSKSGKAPAQANPIVRIYFAGADNLSADTDSTAFTNIFCSSQARALQSQTLDKLSRAPGVWFKDKLSPGAGDGSAQLRPLLDDLLKSKWVFQMADAASSPEYALAIQLNDSRGQLWQTNLRSLLESWTQIKAHDITGGWELKKDMPPNLFRVVRQGDWLVIGCGQDTLPLGDSWATGALVAPKPGEGGQPADTNEMNWLSAKVDWPRLAQIFPAVAKFDLPTMQMQVVGSGSNLLSSGTIDLSQPLPALADWQVPTTLIHQPLTSFTAVRGIAPWLENQPWAKWLQLSPEPDQAFIWSLGISPLQTFLAFPVTNTDAALTQLNQDVTADTNWEHNLVLPVKLVSTTNSIALHEIPFAVPEVKALNEPSGDFLFADVFPNIPRGEAPQKLLQELDRTNLVAYHWENTPERLKEIPELAQLGLVLTRHRQLDVNSAASHWLNHIGPSLGNSATEVLQTGPAELAFKRSAPAGLTAVELIALANWLEAPNFPGCDLSGRPLPHFPSMHERQMKMQMQMKMPPQMQHPQKTNQPPQQLKTKK